ncbi:MAG: glycosyltransferase [Candidatus Thorarchaeota archaeon]
MRVLYISNTAGAMTPVVRWLIKNGHQSRVVMRKKYDSIGSTSFLDCSVMVDSPYDFYRAVIAEIRKFRPDVVHSNSSIIGVILARMFAPRTPLILMYHGSEIRDRRKVHPEASLTDKIIVSTPDLDAYGEWYDRPVSDIFEYKGGRKLNTALMLYASHHMFDFRENSLEWCRERNIELTIINLDTDPIIPHSEMPAYLSKFEYYIDFKGYGDTRAFSLVALEAMKCGCKIVSDTDPSRIVTQKDYSVRTPQDYLILYNLLKKPSIRQTLRRVPRLIISILKFLLARTTLS